MVFATDMAYDNQLGERFIRETMEAVDGMPIDEASKRKIFADKRAPAVPVSRMNEPA